MNVASIEVHPNPLARVELGSVFIAAGISTDGHDEPIDALRRYEYDVQHNPLSIVIWRVGARRPCRVIWHPATWSWLLTQDTAPF